MFSIYRTSPDLNDKLGFLGYLENVCYFGATLSETQVKIVVTEREEVDYIYYVFYRSCIYQLLLLLPSLQY